MNALVKQEANALAVAPSANRMAVSDVIQHYAVVQEVRQAIMKPKVHFDTIPGTPKPTLLKPGAEALCMAFRIADDYRVEDLSSPDEVRYRVKCIGDHQVGQHKLGEGMGEASSSEEKYKWRKAICDEEFDETPANLRRIKYAKSRDAGGFYKQKQIRTEPADMRNTVLKMALKRAKVGMTINVTACSDMFNQDLEDMDAAMQEHIARHPDEEGGEQPEAKAAFLSAAEFDKHSPTWRKVMASGKAKADDVIAKVNAANPKTPLSEEQIGAIRAMEPKPTEHGAAAPTASPADVLAKFEASATEDDLNTAMDLASAQSFSDADRAQINTAYDARLTALRG